MSNKLISLLLLITIFGSIINLYGSSVSGDQANLLISSSNMDMDEVPNSVNDLVNNNINLNTANKVNKIQKERIFEYENFSTEIKTDKSDYKPGETVIINSTSSTDGLNGSVSWTLTSPLNEQAFDFSKEASEVFFDDPNFENTSVIDWVSNGFENSTVQPGASLENWLNLTTIDNSTYANLSYIQYNDIEGKFDIEFQYTVIKSDNLTNMTFSYWNGSELISKDIESTFPNVWETFSLKGDKAVTVNSKTSENSTFVISLNNSKAIWYIKPIKIAYHLDDIDISEENVKSGIVENIWLHGTNNEIRDIIIFNYEILYSTDSTPYANFEFLLPDSDLYFGDWQFNLLINPINETSTDLGSHNFLMPILIKDIVDFKDFKQYIYRGTNTTSNEPIFKDETGITNVFSPTDNISLVGELISGDSSPWKIDSSYFKELSGYVISNSTSLSNLDLVWGNNTDDLGKESLFEGFNNSDNLFSSVIKNQLPIELNNSNSWLLNYRILNRGLYGEANQTLYITFPSFIKVNDTENNTISDDFILEVDLSSSITIKYLVNVSTFDLPFNRTWFITELMEGNFSVKTYRYNSSSLVVNSNETDIEFELELNFPLNDLNFTVGLVESSEDFVQTFILNFIDDFYYFSGSIDTNLKTNTSYILVLHWNSPDDADLENLPFKSGSNFSYAIRGTLTIQLPNQEIIVHQGENLNIEFNVSVDQLKGKRASGFILTAKISNSSLDISIIEREGKYYLISAIPDDFATGTYSINLFKAQTGDFIGKIVIIVISAEINPQDSFTVIPDYLSFLGMILGLIILAGFILGVLKRK